jgi:P27 family predicted phage terminase small subunit
MPGPPPQPAHLRLLRGNPGRRPIKPEPQPEIAVVVPEPPEFLTGHACDEWYRVAPELHRLQLLTVVDVNALAAYCAAYKRWRTAEETLNEMAKRDPVTSGLIIRSSNTKAPMQNPLVLIAKQAASDMVRYASEFGMTAAARARIAAGVYNSPSASKFGDLLT